MQANWQKLLRKQCVRDGRLSGGASAILRADSKHQSERNSRATWSVFQFAMASAAAPFLFSLIAAVCLGCLLRE